MTLRDLLIALLFLMLPAWLLAGFGDWFCHRRTSIERTSGPPESALHLLLYLLIAVPIVLGLFLEIDALLLGLMAACVLAHTAVSLWDTSVAQPRRYIAPFEQHIHSYLEMLPLFALALVFVLRRDPVRVPEAWSWGVTLALLPGLLLIVEELSRCLRAARVADPSSQ
jgi:hypothetical protein